MKNKRFMIIAIAAIALLVVYFRFIREARSDSLEDAYSNVAMVDGFVMHTEPFIRHIEETGTLTGNREAIIAAETGGRVIRIFVEIGDTVKAGSPLVRLDDELYQLESERAKIVFDKAQLDFNRIEKLYNQQSVSESDLENARLGMKGAEVQYRMALKTYQDATIRAPFNGTVAAKMTEVGQTIERGMPVVQFVDISSLKLSVPVSESDIGSIMPGSFAQVIVEAAGDTVEAVVSAVGSRALSGSRTYPVELTISGGINLRSGMFARAIIPTSTAEDEILLPRSATLPDMGRTVVFLARGSEAVKAVVRVIGTQGDRVAVEGLQAGDTVIVTGNQLLSQGSPINLTLTDGAVYDTH
ncbi:MAG: efflux RND transporter periplasmic adaptor subunit [Calditrichota bacterium]